MEMKYYRDYVKNTVGDGNEYKKGPDGVYYCEPPMVVAAAPVGITDCSFPKAVGVADCAFSYCKKLERALLPRLLVVGYWGFAYCKKLRVLPELSQVLIIHGGAFCGSGLEYANASSAEKIPYGAFSFCSELKTVVLSDDLRKIDEAAFFMSRKLEEITLPEGLKELGEYALNRTAIRQITIPKGIKQLSAGVLGGCERLNSVTIHEGSVEKIDDRALSECDSLKCIYLPRSVEEIHERAFEKTPLESVICHRNSYAERWAKEQGYKIEYRA